MPPRRGISAWRPPGIPGLAIFFALGALISLASGVTLLSPNGLLEPMWRLKPSARDDLIARGAWGIVLMWLVSAACGASAAGLWRQRPWGRRLALGVLWVNLAGDLTNAVIRHDARTLIGLPIGGAMIAYLLRGGVRRAFEAAAGSGAGGEIP